jgi:hypothetical protein
MGNELWLMSIARGGGGKGGENMKKVLVSVLALALVGGGLGVTSAIGADDRTPARRMTREVVSKSRRDVGQLEARLSRMQQRLNRSAAAGCRTLSCINRNLKQLRRAVATLAGAVGALAHDAFVCEQITPVTSYFGYDYFGTPGAVTALDYTDTGDVPDDWMVVYTC